MRRVLVSTLAVPAFLLAACGGDEASVDEAVTPAATSEAEETMDDTMETSEPMAPAETSDAMEETEAPADDAMETTAAGDMATETGAAGEVPGGEEGEAAAAVTKDFLVALSTADPALCQLIVAVTGDGPMADSPDQVQLCEEDLVPTLEGMMSEDEAAIIDLIDVNGAQVDGDTATVSAENFDELFAAGFGEDSIQLRKFDDQWYVDLENSFGN